MFKAESFHILIVDDERNIRRSLRMVLEGEGYQVSEAQDGVEMYARLDQGSFDLLILDIKMPGEDGLSLLKHLRDKKIDTPVLMMSGHASIADAVEATRLGALDFFEKPLQRDRVLLAVRNSLDRIDLETRVDALEAQLHEQERELIGESPAMQKLQQTIRKVAGSHGRVLITGESGTGKELVAHALHSQSALHDGPFVKVNCAAIAPGLIESELFGHERGSFSGADRRKRGLFELADGGSIFLDEIGDMSLSAQAKVLRVLQTGDFSRVGGERNLHVKVRVIAATNAKLDAAVAAGTFREDLYYRLAVVPIELPPLRDRADDIPLLARAFLQEFCAANHQPLKTFSAQAMQRMQSYRWPGNVRELRNVCERLVILADDPIELDDLPAEIRQQDDTLINLSSFGDMSLRELREKVDRAAIIERLKKEQGNVTRAALSLGVERTNLHKKIKQLNIQKEDFS